MCEKFTKYRMTNMYISLQEKMYITRVLDIFGTNIIFQLSNFVSITYSTD